MAIGHDLARGRLNGLVDKILKIKVSAVQFRPWAPRKALQQRNLEATGG
jgi:hypothetical protein